MPEQPYYHSADHLAYAHRLDPKQFRAWLRKLWRSGDEPLLDGHILGNAWVFSRRDGDYFARRFRTEG